MDSAAYTLAVTGSRTLANSSPTTRVSIVVGGARGKAWQSQARSKNSAEERAIMSWVEHDVAMVSSYMRGTLSPELRNDHMADGDTSAGCWCSPALRVCIVRSQAGWGPNLQT